MVATASKGTNTSGLAGELVLPAAPLTLLPVVGSKAAFPVRRIYCVGRNYLAHVRELSNNENEPPFFFQKQRDMIVHDGGTVRYPGLTSDFQHEIELVVALGSGGVDIAQERAESHIFGYAVGFDMTRRDRQNDMRRLQRPWEIAKSFEDCAPCGAVTPVARSGLLNAGAIRLCVNGAIKQDSDISNLIWSVPKLIAALSQQAELAAGDLIYTGTPAGVGPVLRGDLIEGEIVALTPLRVTVV